MVGHGIVSMWQNESSHSWISSQDKAKSPSKSHWRNAWLVKAWRDFLLAEVLWFALANIEIHTYWKILFLTNQVSIHLPVFRKMFLASGVSNEKHSFFVSPNVNPGGNSAIWFGVIFLNVGLSGNDPKK